MTKATPWKCFMFVVMNQKKCDKNVKINYLVLLEKLVEEKYKKFSSTFLNIEIF